MPVYRILDNLTLPDGTFIEVARYRGKTVLHGLYQIKGKSRKTLEEKGLIKELKNTPPLSYFDALSDYAILLDEMKINNLGDFAGLNPSQLDETLQALQVSVLKFLNPDDGTPLPERDCENCP